MLIATNSGSDYVDIADSLLADRIGKRIRTIRQAKGMTQAELGEKVGISGDRIQKYENGARKPNLDLIKAIAKALEVEAMSLTDPIISSHIGAMYAFFEMEEKYGLKPIKTKDGYVIKIDNDILNDYIQKWYEEIEKNKSLSENDENYKEWKWTFPKALVDKTQKELAKKQIEDKIKELEELKKKLD